MTDNQSRNNSNHTLGGSKNPEVAMNTRGSKDDKQVSGRQDLWTEIASDPSKLKYWEEIARLWRGSLDCRVGLEARGRN